MEMESDGHVRLCEQNQELANVNVFVRCGLKVSLIKEKDDVKGVKLNVLSGVGVLDKYLQYKAAVRLSR